MYAPPPRFYRCPYIRERSDEEGEERALGHVVIHDSAPGVFTLALVVHVIGRIGEHHVGFLPVHQGLDVGGGAISAHEPVLSELVDVAALGSRLSEYLRDDVVILALIHHEVTAEAGELEHG